MSKAYKNPEEMIKNQEENKKEAIKNLYKINNELKNSRKKRVLKIILPIIMLFILFKMFIGEIHLNLPIYYNHRLYEVTVNEELVNVCIDEYRKKTIIPFIIYNNYVGLHCFHQDNVEEKTNIFNKGDEIHITINSFECFNLTNDKMSCYPNYKNLTKKEAKDIKYSLRIVRNYKGETVIYDGDFIDDITNYFVEKGTHSISIIAEHGNVKSIVSFSIKIE
jgi:hypothetical protein